MHTDGTASEQVASQIPGQEWEGAWGRPLSLPRGLSCVASASQPSPECLGGGPSGKGVRRSDAGSHPRSGFDEVFTSDVKQKQ